MKRPLNLNVRKKLLKDFSSYGRHWDDALLQSIVDRLTTKFDELLFSMMADDGDKMNNFSKVLYLFRMYGIYTSFYADEVRKAHRTRLHELTQSG